MGSDTSSRMLSSFLNSSPGELNFSFGEFMSPFKEPNCSGLKPSFSEFMTLSNCSGLRFFSSEFVTSSKEPSCSGSSSSSSGFVILFKDSSCSEASFFSEFLTLYKESNYSLGASLESTGTGPLLSFGGFSCAIVDTWLDYPRLYE